MRTIISTPDAPAAIGPYSQAVRCGNLLFASGQIPLRPDGTMLEGDIKAQTRQVLENLSAVLRAAGSSPARVVKTTVFMLDLGEFQAMNGVYAEFFGDQPPARATVEVAALPRCARVEIELIAESDTWASR
jgi:2-iminobutanoate/2-iminopropanoate deaminase